ncbi:MAG: lipopolysaccharide heptosyltransferase II [Desulfuromonas sp.]|nr:MAG: lipopolysaccharide heptosyltransferase II [Desulfuromonas sp.]
MASIHLLKKIDKYLGRFICSVLPSPRNVQFGSVGKVLIVRPGGIGDAVHLIPAIKALKEKYPDAVVDILAEKRNCQVFDLCPEINAVHVYDQPSGLMNIFRQSWDLVIDTEQWHLLSAVVARLARSSWKIGFDTNERRRMFTHPVHYRHDCYEVDSFLVLLKPLGVDSGFNYQESFLTLPASSRQAAKAQLSQLHDKTIIAIFPGASIAERRWGASKFHALAKSIAEKGYLVVVIGGPEDKAPGDRIVGSLPNALNLAGSCTLVESAAIISCSRLLVSGDSGVLHIGVGLGKPTVSLFGPGNAKKWAPRGDRHRVLEKQIACSPCTKFGYTPKCHIGVKCMREITVNEVFTAAMELLQQEEAS